jgi:hypothetical protein
MRFLNLGCGDQIADRWENADMRAREGVTKATLGYRLPWDDATFDGVVCHHVLDILDDADLSYGLSAFP